MNEKCPVCQQRPTIMGPVAPDIVIINFVEKGLESAGHPATLFSLNVEMPTIFIEAFGVQTWTAMLMNRMERLYEKEIAKHKDTIKKHIDHIGELKQGLEE